jgi:3-dehydroquinate synthase
MLPSGFAPKDLYEQRFTVEFDYPVAFVEGAFAAEQPALAWAITRREPERRHPIQIVVDGGLALAQPALLGQIAAYVERHATALDLRGEPLLVPGGEAAKNDPGLVARLLEAFAHARLDRQAAVIAVGGGAVLDAVGYAASVTHRGLRFVRLPSTVLSQCDGGVGVKTSVNGFAAKNFLGTFAPPHAVIDDFALLASLPLRDSRAGMAEAVKVALIRDADFFTWLEGQAGSLSRAEPAALATLIRRCAALHLGHIATGGDPFELGSARPLDYGHWAAHKLEILSNHELRHGEAVAIGMLLDARYAERTGLLPASELERIATLLERLGLPLHHPALLARSGGRLAVLRGLEEFREHLGGSLSVTLLTGIGRGREVQQIDAGVVEEAIGWLTERAGRA